MAIIIFRNITQLLYLSTLLFLLSKVGEWAYLLLAMSAFVTPTLFSDNKKDKKLSDYVWSILGFFMFVLMGYQQQNNPLDALFDPAILIWFWVALCAYQLFELFFELKKYFRQL